MPEDEYEFNTVEHKTLSNLMDSIRGAGGATVLMCVSHSMASAAKLFSPTVPSGECAPCGCCLHCCAM